MGSKIAGFCLFGFFWLAGFVYAGMALGIVGKFETGDRVFWGILSGVVFLIMGSMQIRKGGR